MSNRGNSRAHEAFMPNNEEVEASDKTNDVDSDLSDEENLVLKLLKENTPADLNQLKG